MSNIPSAKNTSTKKLLASSAVAFGLLVGLGSAQAQQDGVVAPTVGTSRQITVEPAAPSVVAPQPGTEQPIDAAPGAQQDGPGAPSLDPQTDQRADAPDGPPPDANVASGQPNDPQDAPPPVGALSQPDAGPTTTATAPVIVDPKPTLSEEAKRKNRQRYIERYEERQYVEPRHKYREPRYVEREYVEPRYVAPKPRYVEPRYVEPRYERYERPRYVEPRYYAPSREYYGRGY